MKIYEKQSLKSSSMLSMFFLVSLSLGIIATPWNRGSNDSSSEKALQRAEIVGYQFAQLYREASKNVHDTVKTAREPASAASALSDLRTVGTIGMDGWGRPYHYRILSTDQSKLRVLIWSSGPDGAVQTAELENEEINLPQQPTFAGDDLGVVMSMAVN